MGAKQEPSPSGRGTEAEIIEVQAKLHRAFFEGDVDKLKRLLVPSGYVHTDIWGKVYNKD